MNEKNKMEALPIELCHLIFDHLQLVDLSTCARISRTFRVAVREYRIRELAFDRRTKTEWFHSRSSTHQHRVDFAGARMLSSSPFNFDYLKRLKIGSRSSIPSLNEINQFVHLEELDIDLRNYVNEESRTLSLANLRLLYLFVPDDIPFLELDTPNLQTLCTVALQALDFNYPESIRCLHTFSHDGKLTLFRNLESLLFTDYYNQFERVNFIEFNTEKLAKLKEVEFFYNSYRVELY